jgi:DNA-directed RNA polymerase beta' subunit
LDIFMNMTGADSAVARRLTVDGEMHLVAQRGVIDKQGQVLALPILFNSITGTCSPSLCLPH